MIAVHNKKFFEIGCGEKLIFNIKDSETDRVLIEKIPGLNYKIINSERLESVTINGETFQEKIICNGDVLKYKDEEYRLGVNPLSGFFYIFRYIFNKYFKLILPLILILISAIIFFQYRESNQEYRSERLTTILEDLNSYNDNVLNHRLTQDDLNDLEKVKKEIRKEIDDLLGGVELE